LTKFVGECNEKDLPIIKDQWRNLMIDRLEEALERPYQIEVFKENFSFSFVIYLFFLKSPFEINITFDFNGENEELQFL